MNDEQSNSGGKKGAVIATAIVGLLVIVAIATYAMRPKSDDAATVATPSPVASASPAAEVKAAEDTKYKDGSYTATGEYRSPGGPETIGVTLVLKDNVVSEVTVEPKAELPNSKVYQEKFIGGVKDVVVGKSVSELKLDKVAGSSLTPMGFNDALAKIKTQAKS